MKAAPGAVLPVDQILGRDELIARLWAILKQNSVRIEAERRIGKTCVLRKMRADPPDDWDVVFLDLEKVHSVAEFSELVCREVQNRLAFWKRQGSRMLKFLEGFRGAEVAGLKFPEKKDRPDGYWKRLLTCTIEDLVEQQQAVGRTLIFLFDEMPWMISAIAERDSPEAAMELLDVLRSLRQDPVTGPFFRMLMCGSVGLHHVLGELKAKGYRNQPVNDMILVEVPPLDQEEARRLALALMVGDNLGEDEEVASYIAQQTGGFAYYIHWIVNLLKSRGVASCPAVDEAIHQLLTAAHDPCDLRHFLTRLDTYYSSDARTAIALLDHVANVREPVLLHELLNIAKSSGAVDDHRTRDLLRLLTQDHYLVRAGDAYRFRSSLVQLWWKGERGLS